MTPTHANCVVRDPRSYPWHDQGFRPPAFNDLVVCQLHIGAFFSSHRPREGGYLDVLAKLEYLKALGVNAIEPLPVAEFETAVSMGYNGTDIFSPELRYGTTDPVRLDRQLALVNDLLARRGRAPLTREHLSGPVNQLKGLIDVCHVHGLAVILDVVYNHAGGFDGDDGSIYFFDNQPAGNNNDRCYFTDQGWAGGLVFAFWKQEVRQFLIDNARFFADEYHADGFRYDEVSVIVDHGGADGWRFCQDLTRTVDAARPAGPQIAEFWPVNGAIVSSVDGGGAGFDATWSDRLRDGVRNAVRQASGGAAAPVDLDAVGAALARQSLLPAAWKAVQYIENHDVVYKGRSPRVPELADPSDSRSWYARGRARVAGALLLTAPGIPMLFMGQEFLEDKQWSDNLPRDSDRLIWWDGLAQGVKPMVDHLRMTQDLIGLRQSHPAVRGEQVNVYHVHNRNRVIAYHRWLEGTGEDLVIVGSLAESTVPSYELGFPRPGRWAEIFNSDVYDDWVNPAVAGNGGGIAASGPLLHGLPSSTAIVIPANAVLVFAYAGGL